MPIKPDEHGRFWGIACKNCKQVKDWAKCKPMRIQARSVNNARTTQEWYFCSAECLVEYTSVDPEWGQGVEYSRDATGKSVKVYTVSNAWLKEMY